jgi:hypothetical protein
LSIVAARSAGDLRHWPAGAFERAAADMLDALTRDWRDDKSRERC